MHDEQLTRRKNDFAEFWKNETTLTISFFLIRILTGLACLVLFHDWKSCGVGFLGLCFLSRFSRFLDMSNAWELRYIKPYRSPDWKPMVEFAGIMQNFVISAYYFIIYDVSMSIILMSMSFLAYSY